MNMLRLSPGLMVWLGIFAMTTVLMIIIGILMSRSGASLRPVYWFFGLMLLIGGPQLAAHFYNALTSTSERAPRIAALYGLHNEPNRETRRQFVQLLFGQDADPDLVVDARKIFGDALAKAQAASLASFATGESILLATFNGYTDAEKAWVGYLRVSGLSSMEGKGDSQRGYAVTRPSGDRAYALHMDNMLGVWTGPDDLVIRKRMVATGFAVPRRAPLAELPNIELPESAPPTGQTEHSLFSNLNPGVIAAGVTVWVFIVVLYFFKGAAWAGTSAPKPDVQPLSAGELINRLNSINTLDVPVSIESGARPNEWMATFRYADAKWLDLARARGLRRWHRIKLVLDETDRTVRATEYSAKLDWSAGRHGADLAWECSMGITFFEYQHHRVFGLQFDANGRPTPVLTYAYTFDLQELKSPLIQAVTNAGWTWRPVGWPGPRWLRWLTE